MKAHVMTAARKQALRKAQMISAQKRHAMARYRVSGGNRFDPSRDIHRSVKGVKGRRDWDMIGGTNRMNSKNLFEVRVHSGGSLNVKAMRKQGYKVTRIKK
jgi:hypothetical protein